MKRREAVGDASGPPVRVFILDDHGMARDSIRLACATRPGLSVIGEAGDGRVGLRMILESQPDVVVLDIVLPGMDGLEVARRLTQEGFEGKILVVTGRDDEEIVLATLLLDADGFVPKTAGLDEIADAIQAVGDGASAYSDRYARMAGSKIVSMARNARQRARASQRVTERERQVLHLLAQGMTTRQVAASMKISERTAETHIANLYRKLSVSTRVQAVNKAAALGLVEWKDMIS